MCHSVWVVLVFAIITVFVNLSCSFIHMFGFGLFGIDWVICSKKTVNLKLLQSNAAPLLEV